MGFGDGDATKCDYYYCICAIALCLIPWLMLTELCLQPITTDSSRGESILITGFLVTALQSIFSLQVFRDLITVIFPSFLFNISALISVEAWWINLVFSVFSDRFGSRLIDNWQEKYVAFSNDFSETTSGCGWEQCTSISLLFAMYNLIESE